MAFMKFDCHSLAAGGITTNEKPDLILLDIMMPGLNGYELTQILKSDTETQDIPIVLVTAFGGSEYEIKGLEAGADESLNKPVNRTELLTRVKSLIRLRQYKEQMTLEVEDSCLAKRHLYQKGLSLRFIRLNLPHFGPARTPWASSQGRDQLCDTSVRSTSHKEAHLRLCSTLLAARGVGEGEGERGQGAVLSDTNRYAA